MEDSFAPASQLIGAALPPGLVWERSGRRLLSRFVAGAALAALAAIGCAVAWPRLVGESATAAREATAAPLPHGAVRGGHAVTAIARAIRDVAAVEAARQVVVPLRQAEAAWAHRRYDTGEASYYARGFEGRSTASGEVYRAAKLTAAHRTLPFGTLLRVTNVRNGRSVVVRVNDRGPFHSRRVVDLSRAAAAELGLVRRGRGQVRLDVLTR